MNLYTILEIFQIIFSFAFMALLYFVRFVPDSRVYIIDRNSHYLKTVKKGFFFFAPYKDEITTIISTFPTTKKYCNVFETEDGKQLLINFSVTYSAKDIDDLLYNLEKVRRSIDDILQSAMYNAVRNINSKSAVVSKVLPSEFLRNLQAQAMSIGLDIRSHSITSISFLIANQNKAFKPHKNYSNSPDPIQYS